MKNQKNEFDIFIEKTYLFLKNKLNLNVNSQLFNGGFDE
jgi:hypothetical protein